MSDYERAEASEMASDDRTRLRLRLACWKARALEAEARNALNVEGNERHVPALQEAFDRAKSARERAEAEWREEGICWGESPWDDDE